MVSILSQPDHKDLTKYGKPYENMEFKIDKHMEDHPATLLLSMFADVPS